MEIRIGIVNSPRELSFESSDSADAIRDEVVKAVETGTTQVVFTDERGSTYIVPTAGIAYVEVGSDNTRRIGFVG